MGGGRGRDNLKVKILDKELNELRRKNEKIRREQQMLSMAFEMNRNTHNMQKMKYEQPNRNAPVNLFSSNHIPSLLDINVNMEMPRQPLMHSSSFVKHLPPPTMQSNFGSRMSKPAHGSWNNSGVFSQSYNIKKKNQQNASKRLNPYPVKSNVVNNFQGPSQFHHQPPAPGNFQAQSHVQQTSWPPPVPPPDPQLFHKSNLGGQNQMGFNDNHQGPMQGTGPDGGYNDYDQGPMQGTGPDGGYNDYDQGPMQGTGPDGGYNDYDQGDQRYSPQQDQYPGDSQSALPGPSGIPPSGPSVSAPPGGSEHGGTWMQGSFDGNEEGSADPSQDNTGANELVNWGSDEDEDETDSNEDENSSDTNDDWNSGDENNLGLQISGANANTTLTGGDNQMVYYNTECRKMIRSLPCSARKRFKILISDNVPWQKAYEMCQKPWRLLPPEANPRKRARMERKNKKIDLIMAGKLPAVTNKNYFLNSHKCAQVTIQNERYMPEDKAWVLLETLIAKIMQVSKGDGPRFDGYGYQGGVFTVRCKDKQSQMWLVNTVSQIEPWPGAKLTAAVVRIPPRPMVVNVLLPESETKDVSQAFKLLKLQNRGLNTEEWVLRSSDKVTGGWNVSIVIDIRSAIALRETDFQACLGLKTVCFNRLYEATVSKINAKKPKRGQKWKRGKKKK